MTVIELPWREYGDFGFKAETPIGDYVVYPLHSEIQNLWTVDLWEGPAKQGEALTHAIGPDGAKKAALDHYNKILRQMQELPANLNSPAQNAE